MAYDAAGKEYVELPIGGRSKNPSDVKILPDTIDASKQLLKKQIAFACESSTFHNIVRLFYSNIEVCELRQQSLLNDPVYFYLLKRSQYTQMFRIGLIWMDEVGLLAKMGSSYNIEMPPCVEAATVYSVTLEQVQSAFYLLMGAMALSIVMLIGENLVSRKYGLKALKIFKLPGPLSGRIKIIFGRKFHQKNVKRKFKK